MSFFIKMAHINNNEQQNIFISFLLHGVLYNFFFGNVDFMLLYQVIKQMKNDDSQKKKKNIRLDEEKKIRKWLMFSTVNNFRHFA